jgi:hypothetical protein
VISFVIGTAFLVALSAPAAMAQARPSAPAAKPAASSSASDSNGDFGVGYSFLNGSGSSAGAGFDAFYAKDFRTMSMGSLGFVGDFSVNHGNGGTAELVTGGARINFKGSSTMKAKIYGQVTGGLAHAFNSSQFELDFGGGVTYPLSGKKFGLYGQVDFPVVFFSGGSITFFRLNVGITMPIGK